MRPFESMIAQASLATLAGIALAIPAVHAGKPEKPVKAPAFEPAYYDVTVEVIAGVDFWIEPEEWIEPEDWPAEYPYPPVIGTITADDPNDGIFIWGLRDGNGEYFTAPAYIDFRGFGTRFNLEVACDEEPTPDDWWTCFSHPEDPPDQFTRQNRVVQIHPDDDPATEANAIVQINWEHRNANGAEQYYEILIQAEAVAPVAGVWDPLALEEGESATLLLSQFVVRPGTGKSKNACTACGTFIDEDGFPTAFMTIARLAGRPTPPWAEPSSQ